jgi:hypothetical protein
MGFRLIACIVAFLALVVIFDEIHKVDRTNRERILELHRRLTEAEEKKEPLPERGLESFMCVPWSDGPSRAVPPNLDELLDAQDFKKNRRYK